MLALTRNTSQKIIIKTAHETIEVMVLGINSRTQVRLGVDAPPHVTIDREEIAERKRAGVPRR